MAYINNNDTSTSSFLTDSFEGIGGQFTDFHELSAQGYSLLLKAKRYGRWYVLKTLSEDTMRQSAYTQILRKEFEVLIQLQHPGIVQAMGLENVDGIGPCIVMEYIDGDDLATLMAGDHAMSRQERLRIIGEVGEALAYVHAAGIVHRDLKPENIMITRNGHRAKLVDFGMADSDQHAVLKQPAGTLTYMSPEQAQQAVPDVRNDIYSLGIIMQQLDLGKSYDKLIGRCLKPIGQRYANMDEVLADLRRLRDRSGSWRWWAVAAGLSLLVVLLGVQTWRLHSADADRQQIEVCIDSLRTQLHSQQQRVAKQQEHSAMTQAAMEQQIAASMRTLSDSIQRLNMSNEQLHSQLTIGERAQAAAMKALRQEMRRSGVRQHLDTLSDWAYRWPDLTQRIVGVSQFVHSYVEALPSELGHVYRDNVRDAMLGEWQSWSRQLSTQADAIRHKAPQQNKDDVKTHRNKPPKDKL